MKIGILTFHCAHNYGAVLQAFALQKFLKGLGHEVEIIDYRPSYLLDAYSIIPAKQKMRQLLRHTRSSNENSISLGYKNSSPRQKKLRKFIGLAKRLLPWVLWNIICQQRGFKNFISQKLDLSRERFSKVRTPKRRYDAIIFGSDQIWNPYITGGGCDPVFLGDFPTPEKTMKIAYAASAGRATDALGKTPAFVNALKNFDAISVREQNLADAIKQNFKGEIKVVLDPTLLVEKVVWDKIAVTPKTKRKYVLVYQVLSAPAINRIAHELAEQIGADVVSIWAGSGRKPKGDLCGESLEKFVGWFKNAACVVTTSFHGTAFSLIYERPLYYVSKGKGEAAENRPRHILRELGLLDRIVGEDAHPKFSEIDYSNSNARLETLRSASREFLETALIGRANDVAQRPEL